jgi:signal transduction histidine kinase
MEFKRHILMMFKEILNNILRHARAKQVDIQVDLQESHLRLSVHDDGVGFDVGMPSTGFGLAGLRTRAAAIGGNLTVDSTPGTGTRVCLEVDIIRSND